MDSADLLKVVIAINASTLLAIISYGYKAVTYLNRIEFRTEVMWKDYNRRMSASEDQFHTHKRSTDLED